MARRERENTLGSLRERDVERAGDRASRRSREQEIARGKAGTAMIANRGDCAWRLRVAAAEGALRESGRSQSCERSRFASRNATRFRDAGRCLAHPGEDDVEGAELELALAQLDRGERDDERRLYKLVAGVFGIALEV